ATLRAVVAAKRKSASGRPSVLNFGATCQTRSSASWSTASTSQDTANFLKERRRECSAPATHRPKACASPAEIFVRSSLSPEGGEGWGEGLSDGIDLQH